jgi:hypothetical protein
MALHIMRGLTDRGCHHWGMFRERLSQTYCAPADMRVRFQRCTSLIAQLWLTANRAAAARARRPPRQPTFNRPDDPLAKIQRKRSRR